MKIAISLTSLVLLLAGCSRETPEQAQILDSISCPGMGADEFRLTSRLPPVADFTDSVGAITYGLAVPLDVTTSTGSTLHIESDGPLSTKGRLTLKQNRTESVICAGEGSLIRQESQSDAVNDDFRARVRLVNLSDGPECDRPLAGEIDVCLSPTPTPAPAPADY